MSAIRIEAIQALAEPKIFERGKSYYEEGMIINPIMRDNRIEAFSHGSQIYRVSAYISEGHIGQTHCSCPYDWGGVCKHIVALLLTYLLQPKLFIKRLTIGELLLNKNRQDLINIIETMLDRHPTLLELVDPNLDLPEELFWDDDY